MEESKKMTPDLMYQHIKLPDEENSESDTDLGFNYEEITPMEIAMSALALSTSLAGLLVKSGAIDPIELSHRVTETAEALYESIEEVEEDEQSPSGED